jgi:glycerophosphoryl diester phosphodiesterase
VSGPLLLGHRGDSANHAENTLAAFAAASACGADGVELDVQVSADGEPVVIRDPTLERTTAGRGRVDAHTWQELEALGVPHLRDALGLLRGHVVAVELKPPYDASPTLAAGVLDLASGDDSMLLLAFDHRHLAATRSSHPRARRVPLVREPPDDPRALLDACGGEALAVPWQQVDAALCAMVPVVAWTVDDKRDAATLLDMGVAVVISNRPCALRGMVPRR